MIRKLIIAITVLLTVNSSAQLAITIPNDFEKSESMLLTWSYNSNIDSVQAQIVKLAKDHADIGIIYNPDSLDYDTTDIRLFLQTLNADSSNVTLISAYTNTPFLAQYAPIVGYGVFADTLERYFGNPMFDSYSRPQDDSLASQLAHYYSWNNVDYNLQFEANNIIYDGLRHMIVGDRVLTENPGMTQNEIQFELFQYYNSGICTFISNLNNSGGGVLNSLENYIKLVDFETFIVSSLPDTLPDYEVLESIAAQLGDLQTYFGDPFNIFRISIAPESNGNYPTDKIGENRSYTNSIVINDLVIVPLYGNAEKDEQAWDMYNELYQGYTIKSLNSETLSANHSGLHTLTKVIPQKHLLRILHKKVTGLQPYSPFVKINCLCEADNYVEEMWLYYKVNDDTAYTVKSIELVCPQHFAIIDKLNPGDTVSYYIEAVSASTITTYPLSAPEGNFTFWLDVMGQVDKHNSEPKILISPNPGKGVFKIYSAITEEVDLELFNNLGQLILKKKFVSNSNIDLSKYLKPGNYTVVIRSSGETVSLKYISL